jgi:hypothetical protein
MPQSPLTKPKLPSTVKKSKEVGQYKWFSTRDEDHCSQLHKGPHGPSQSSGTQLYIRQFKHAHLAGGNRTAAAKGDRYRKLCSSDALSSRSPGPDADVPRLSLSVDVEKMPPSSSKSSRDPFGHSSCVAASQCNSGLAGWVKCMRSQAPKTQLRASILHSTEPLGVIFSNCRSVHAPRREWMAVSAAVKNTCGRWEPRKRACRDESGRVGRTGA